MTFVETDVIEDLSDHDLVRQTAGVIRGLARNIEQLRDLSPEQVRKLYQNIAEALDECDEQDSFGSAGWRNFIT